MPRLEQNHLGSISLICVVVTNAVYNGSSSYSGHKGEFHFVSPFEVGCGHVICVS